MLYSENYSQQQNLGAATYNCPMHSEVNSDKPGKCPKCWMTLVKKK
jgi:hypothetical protein